MKTFKTLIALFLSVSLVSSCSTIRELIEPKPKLKTTPLTGALVREYKMTPRILQGFQFFTGPTPIVLERSDSLKDASIGYGGKALLRNSDVIRIEPYTPGVCIGVDSSGILTIKFGEDNKRALRFGPSREDKDGAYVLYMLKDSDNIVRYAGKKYAVTSFSGIEIDPLKIQNLQVEPGNRVNQY